MRKLWISVAVVVVLLLLGVGGVWATNFAGLRPLPEREEIPGLGWQISDGYVGVSVLDAGQGRVVLVDAGSSEDAAAIKAELTREGRTPDDVIAILLTHGHPDHTAGIGAFPKATVYALDTEAPYLRGELTYAAPLSKALFHKPTGKGVTRTVRDGEALHEGDLDVLTFALPGHTPGSTAWFIKGVLFLGDAASLSAGGNFVDAPWIFSDDLQQARGSLRSLKDRLAKEVTPLARVVTSHTGQDEGPGALDRYTREAR